MIQSPSLRNLSFIQGRKTEVYRTLLRLDSTRDDVACQKRVSKGWETKKFLVKTVLEMVHEEWIGAWWEQTETGKGGAPNREEHEHETKAKSTRMC